MDAGVSVSICRKNEAELSDCNNDSPADVGLDCVHSSLPDVPSLAANKRVVKLDARNAGFELPAPELISAEDNVPGPNAVLFHNSWPFIPLSAEMNSVLL